MYGICLLIVKYLIQIPSTCKNEKSVTNMKTWSRVDSGHIALKTAGPRFVKKSREGKLAAHLQLWQHSSSSSGSELSEVFNYHYLHPLVEVQFILVLLFIFTALPIFIVTLGLIPEVLIHVLNCRHHSRTPPRHAIAGPPRTTQPQKYSEIFNNIKKYLKII